MDCISFRIDVLNDYSLILSKIQRQDQGVYRCLASNGVGVEQTIEVRLTVKGQSGAVLELQALNFGTFRLVVILLMILQPLTSCFNIASLDQFDRYAARNSLQRNSPAASTCVCVFMVCKVLITAQVLCARSLDSFCKCQCVEYIIVFSYMRPVPASHDDGIEHVTNDARANVPSHCSTRMPQINSPFHVVSPYQIFVCI